MPQSSNAAAVDLLRGLSRLDKVADGVDRLSSAQHEGHRDERAGHVYAQLAERVEPSANCVGAARLLVLEVFQSTSSVFVASRKVGIRGATHGIAGKQALRE